MRDNVLNNASRQPLFLNIDARREESSDPAENNSVSSHLASQIKNVDNSSEELSRGARNKGFTESLTHMWRSLWPSGNSQPTEVNDAGESIKLTEVITDGGLLRSQAESLHISRNEQVSPGGWKGSALKRCLVGVGILTGGGILVRAGYENYGEQNSHSGTTGNFTSPASVVPPHNYLSPYHNVKIDSITNVRTPPLDFISGSRINGKRERSLLDKNENFTSPASVVRRHNYLSLCYDLKIDNITEVLTPPLYFISGPSIDNRKERSLPVENRYIPNSILSIVADRKLDLRVMNEFDLIYRRAGVSSDVSNTNSSEEKNIKLLLKTIQITQKCIDSNKYGHAQGNAFEQLLDIRKRLWDIANNLTDNYSKLSVEKFKKFYVSDKEENTSTMIDPHNSSTVTHRTTVPVPIAELVSNDTFVAGAAVAAVAAVAAGAAVAVIGSACTSCVVGGAGAVVGIGSIGVVSDIGNGYVEKKYSSYIYPGHRSRLTAANNNAKGFNRYYGSGAATVSITQDIDMTATVSTKLKKIEGYPLNSFQPSSDIEIEIMVEIASKIINDNPSEYLANFLREKGIIHKDINKGNIIYNKGEFFLVDFDDAIILPEGQMLSAELTQEMRDKLKYVFNDVLYDIRKILSTHYITV
ncbi:hypothetical protein HW114_12085 [Serratia symbiotica]|uniref:hypothetical protein n=1 Tax=Serratia symbiotica TaxID=138074 RepID=UPI0018875C42|nr:hypothetical protein [Serratia symbiotica]MBF1996172.1 hypothetical protein [Serratia symbiotica]